MAKLSHPRNPGQAVKAGIALIPEDRGRDGLARQLPITYNVTAASLGRLSSWGVLHHNAETAVTKEYVGKLRIKCSSGAQLAGRLSGGNQQKVVIAKWLARGAKIFLFDEPTRGIDVGAKVEVFEVMDGLARAGAAILMVSSELPELLQVADRILVMRQGRIAANCPGGSRRKRSCGSRRCRNGQELLNDPTAAAVPTLQSCLSRWRSRRRIFSPARISRASCGKRR